MNADPDAPDLSTATAADDAREAATDAALGLVDAIARRMLADDGYDAAKAEMLAAQKGEADARNALDDAVARAAVASYDHETARRAGLHRGKAA